MNHCNPDPDSVSVLCLTLCSAPILNSVDLEALHPDINQTSQQLLVIQMKTIILLITRKNKPKLH